MKTKLEVLLDKYAAECSNGNEYDNRRRIAEARQAVLDEVDQLLYNASE